MIIFMPTRKSLSTPSLLKDEIRKIALSAFMTPSQNNATLFNFKVHLSPVGHLLVRTKKEKEKSTLVVVTEKKKLRRQ
jgi:hypothetical protein